MWAVSGLGVVATRPPRCAWNQSAASSATVSRAPRLFEEMGCPGDDRQAFLTWQSRHRLLVELDHHRVMPPDDEQRRRAHSPECISCEIGSASSRNHGLHRLGCRSSGDQSSGGPRAGAEQADVQVPQLLLFPSPAQRSEDPLSQQRYVEAHPSGRLIDAFFLGREEIEQERREPCLLQPQGNPPVATTEAAASAPVGEEDKPSWLGREPEGSPEFHRTGPYDHFHGATRSGLHVASVPSS